MTRSDSVRIDGVLFSPLAGRHDDLERIVRQWNKTWLGPQLANRSIEDRRVRISAPLLVATPFSERSTMSSFPVRARLAEPARPGCS